MIPEKLLNKTTVLNKKTNKLKEKPGDIWRHLLWDKSLHFPIVAIYDFETVIVYTDDQSKLEHLKGRKG